MAGVNQNGKSPSKLATILRATKQKRRKNRKEKYATRYNSDENKVIRIAKCDVFSGVCESI